MGSITTKQDFPWMRHSACYNPDIVKLVNKQCTITNTSIRYVVNEVSISMYYVWLLYDLPFNDLTFIVQPPTKHNPKDMLDAISIFKSSIGNFKYALEKVNTDDQLLDYIDYYFHNYLDERMEHNMLLSVKDFQTFLKIAKYNWQDKVIPTFETLVNSHMNHLYLEFKDNTIRIPVKTRIHVLILLVSAIVMLYSFFLLWYDFNPITFILCIFAGLCLNSIRADYVVPLKNMVKTCTNFMG